MMLRQLLAESVLLALVGGGAGLGVAFLGGRALSTFPVISGYFPALDLSADRRVFAFTFLVSFVAGMVFGLAPSLQFSRSPLATALKEAQPHGSYSRSRLRSLLVVSQIAVSLLLLTGAGLLVRTFRKYLAVDPGF